MKYLVTGCSGFLAKPLIKRLRQENCDIVGIARNEGKIIEADCDIITGDRGLIGAVAGIAFYDQPESASAISEAKVKK